MQLFHPSVQLVLFGIFLNRSEVGKNSDKVLEVDLVIIAVPTLEEESMNDPVPEWIDGKLGDP